MDTPPPLRRADKQMPLAEASRFLAGGYCGTLATVGADGWPYACPLLYVFSGGLLWFHNTSAQGHLRSNIQHEPRACFEVDRPGQVFAYGRFHCDSTVEYESVVAFGRVAVVDEDTAKTAFFDQLMVKYLPDDPLRPKHFYPRLHGITLYRMTVERLTGKQTPLPPPSGRWPADDQTRTPDAIAPPAVVSAPAGGQRS